MFDYCRHPSKLNSIHVRLLRVLTTFSLYIVGLSFERYWTLFLLFCIFFCSFGAFFYGYDSGLTTSIIGYPEFITYFNFNATTLGALGSAYYAGNFAGSLMNMYLPDRFGRLNVVRFASVVSILGAGMQTGAKSLGVLLAGRAIGGIGTWLISMCPPQTTLT